MLKQTLTNFELIIVNDGSTDDSLKILDSFSDGRIKIINQTNAGVSAARNRGIKAAKSEYVAFLDADDEWLPHHLESAWKLFKTHPELAWCCAAYERRQLSGKTARIVNPKTNSTIIDNFIQAEAEAEFGCTITMVIKRAVLEEMGGFNVEMTRGEDKNLWYRIGFQYQRIGFLNKVNAIYWATPDSLTLQKDNNTAQLRLDLISATAEAAQSAGHSEDPAVIALLRALIWNAIKRACYYNEKSVLKQIWRKYSNILLWRHKLSILLGLSVGPFFMPMLSRLRQYLHKW